jgi:signal transduction histidine kinase
MSEAAAPTSSPPRASGTDLGATPRLEEVVSADALRELASSLHAISGLSVVIQSVGGATLAGEPRPHGLLESLSVEAGQVLEHDDAGGMSWVVAPIEYDHEVIGRVALGPFSPSEAAAADRFPTANDDGPPSVPVLSAARARAYLDHFRVGLDLIMHAGQRAHYASTMHVASIEESYAELVRKNEELEEAYGRLKQLDHLKSSFLATVSHELRTPLTSIIGYSEMLAEGMCGPLNKDQLEFVQTIRAKSDQLLRLILSLLDLSKLESGTMRMHVLTVPIEAILSDAISTVGPAATKKGVRVSLERGSPVPALRADPDRLRQVFVNLLDNAVKFTPRGGTVAIEAREVESTPAESAGLVLLAPVRREIEIRVKDSGIGIPEHERARVFDAFYQVDQSSTRERGGAGLGLAIVKRIVEAHNGRIRVEPSSPSGATFVVSLPIGTGVSGQLRRAEP